jgi:hypothetical protein
MMRGSSPRMTTQHEIEEMVEGVDPHASSSRSLPGLTRQSIIFARVVQRQMDARVKPAHDDST